MNEDTPENDEHKNVVTEVDPTDQAEGDDDRNESLEQEPSPMTGSVKRPESRFTSEEPPPEEEPEKRNLKTKKIMSSLDDELGDMDDLYGDGEDGATDTTKRKKKGKAKPKLALSFDFKKFQTPAIILGVLGVLGYGYHFMTQPRVGSIGFGMCKVFLEQWVEFPHELRISDAVERRDWVRIWYIQTDSFGQNRMEPIQCHYANTPERGFHMEKISINRRDLDQKLVENFNRSMSAIQMSKEYLHIPWRLPDDISNLRR